MHSPRAGARARAMQNLSPSQTCSHSMPNEESPVCACDAVQPWGVRDNNTERDP